MTDARTARGGRRSPIMAVLGIPSMSPSMSPGLIGVPSMGPSMIPSYSSHYSSSQLLDLS